MKNQSRLTQGHRRKLRIQKKYLNAVSALQ